MRVVEEELEQLELSVCEDGPFSLVAQHAVLGIEPQPMELPDPLIPEIKACVIARHLVLDEGDIDVGRLLRHRVELGQLSLDPFQKAEFEANQIVIDAHPMAGVFPVFGLDVLPFERARGWLFWVPRLHGYNYRNAMEPCCC